MVFFYDAGKAKWMVGTYSKKGEGVSSSVITREAPSVQEAFPSKIQ